MHMVATHYTPFPYISYPNHHETEMGNQDLVTIHDVIVIGYCACPNFTINVTVSRYTTYMAKNLVRLGSSQPIY